MVYQENELLILGKDCPYGYYLIESNSPDSYAKIYKYPLEKRTHSYIETICSFNIVYLTSGPYKSIEVKNGRAKYLGEFDLLEALKHAEISTDMYILNGVSVLGNQFCEIKKYYQNSNTALYIGETIAKISERMIFSINQYYYLALTISKTSYIRYNEVQLCLKDNSSGKEYLYEEDSYESGNTINRYKFKRYYSGEKFYILLNLPADIDCSKLILPWIQLNHPSKKLFLSEKNIKELFHASFNRLENILNKFIALGLDIHFDDNVELIEGYDYIDRSSTLLEKLYEEKSKIDKKTPNKNLQFTFPVGAYFNKKYYCAVKIAENAIDIEASKDDITVYDITFSGDQIDDIALMYHTLTTSFARSNDCMVTIHKYLMRYSYFDYLKDALYSELSYIGKYGYIGSLYTTIINSINKYWRLRIDQKYAEMIQERRVPTKWCSEFRLYSIVREFVPNAVYQYRAEWLGTQSFDIYLPDYRIAIEYQGQQHYKPVEVFGGKSSHYYNVERDLRKRALASVNNVKVIEWSYENSISDNSVRNFLKKHNIETVKKNLVNYLSIQSMLIEMAPPLKVQQIFKERKLEDVPYVIRQYTGGGEFISEYRNIEEAALSTNVSKVSIKKTVTGTRKSGGGYIWKKCNKGSPIENVPPIIVSKSTGVASPVKQMDLSKNLIKIYPSKKAASKQTGINVRSISDAISGVQKTAGGYIWELFNEDRDNYTPLN